MFLRVGWMVGNGGAWESTSIVIVAMTITTITTLSLSGNTTTATITTTTFNTTNTTTNNKKNTNMSTIIFLNVFVAICTNGNVKSGGAYYLISRSLGPR